MVETVESNDMYNRECAGDETYKNTYNRENKAKCFNYKVSDVSNKVIVVIGTVINTHYSRQKQLFQSSDRNIKDHGGE